MTNSPAIGLQHWFPPVRLRTSVSATSQNSHSVGHCHAVSSQSFVSQLIHIVSQLIQSNAHCRTAFSIVPHMRVTYVKRCTSLPFLLLIIQKKLLHLLPQLFLRHAALQLGLQPANDRRHRSLVVHVESLRDASVLQAANTTRALLHCTLQL